MTLPSELLGLIEALETAKADESRPVTVEERRESPVIYTNRLMVLEAARTALIAGIQRYREEGQELIRLSELRSMGWAVTSHNDYRLGGEAYTYWGLVRDGRYIKGEGKTDAEALEQCAAQALRPTPPEEPKP